MKLNQLALAAVAVFGASQAFAAAPTQYLTGASASSTNVMKAARNLCANNGGTFSLYKVDTNTNKLGNVFTGQCSTGFTGATSYTTVAMNVAGGSGSAVLNTAANSATTTQFLAPVAGCSAITGTETLAASNFGAFTLYVCPSASSQGKLPDSTDTDNQFSDGGFMDVEGNLFPSSVIDPTKYNAATDFKLAGFSQAFGVGVNSTLYNALQTAQIASGLIANSTCSSDTTIKYTAACQPTVSKAQIGSLLNNDKGNFAKTAGGKALVGGTTDSTPIVYCERPQTSGTQQSAQLYFLNYGAAGNIAGGVEAIINGGAQYPKTLSASAPYTALINSGSSDVKNCLNLQTAGNNTGTGYRFGLLSLENNPIGGSDTYRFVKLGGAAIAQGSSSSDSNTDNAVSGLYDYVFETVAYCAGGTCPAFVSAILSNTSIALPVGASTAGLFLGNGVESHYSRGAAGVPNAAAPYLTRF